MELGPDAFLASIAGKRFADVDEWQTEMQLKAMRAGRVQLYTTGLDAEERRLTGVETISSLEDAIRESIARTGEEDGCRYPRGTLRRAHGSVIRACIRRSVQMNPPDDEPDIIGDMNRELGINSSLGVPDEDDLLVQQARKMVDDDAFKEELRRHPERFADKKPPEKP